MLFRLSLPGNIVEDGREQAKYDADNGNTYVKSLLDIYFDIVNNQLSYNRHGSR